MVCEDSAVFHRCVPHLRWMIPRDVLPTHHGHKSLYGSILVHRYTVGWCRSFHSR